MDADLAYENSSFISGAEAYPERWARAAQAWRERESLAGRARLNLAYGKAERQALDLFLPAGRPLGLIVFVHGGYWLHFDRRSWSHLAAGAVARGWAMALPSYSLAPQARIGAMTAEIAVAVTHAAGLVAGPVVVCGHSAGGHLSARIACRDVDLPGVVADRLARVVPISPLSDLGPLTATGMNRDLGLDDRQVREESPVHRQPRPGLPVTVWVGAEERPAFLDQARWLAEAWPGAALRIDPGRHHFDVIDGLAEAESPLMQALIGGL